MASSFLRSRCRSILEFLLSWSLGSSDPAAGHEDPNADHDNVSRDASPVDGPSCDCPRTHLEHKPQTPDPLVVPRRQSSVDDVLRIGSSSSPSRSLPGMPAHTDTRDPPPKPQRLSKMLTILRYWASLVEVSTFSSPELIPQSNPNDPTDRTDTLPDLTGQVSRTSKYATSFGGLSDIWRCALKWNGRVVVVAVKSIRAHIADEEEAKKKNRRLRRELKVWSRLRHDNIVPLYGTASGFGPFVALVCPWYENGSLSSYLESVGETLVIVNRFQLLSDVSAGLQYLHSCSIVHGDLTASNVLISSDGRAHLSDFGLSVIVVEFMATSYYTSAFSGTVRWIAPELVAVPEEENTITIPTKESDIYSFGCIMLQGLTGKPPFSEYKRDAQVVVAISLGKKPSRPRLPAIIDHHWAFIMKCWSTKDCRPSAEQVDAYIKEQLHLFQYDSISSD